MNCDTRNALSKTLYELRKERKHIDKTISKVNTMLPESKKKKEINAYKQAQVYLNALRSIYNKTDKEVIDLTKVGKIQQGADYCFWLTLLDRVDLIRKTI